MIATHTNIVAGMKLGAALTNENIARQYIFAAKFFHTQAFGF
jgi:hypothetical protein